MGTFMSLRFGLAFFEIGQYTINIIAKHRKGAIGDVLLNFKGEFTRFANPEDAYVAPNVGGEFIGSRLNSGGQPEPEPDPLGPAPIGPSNPF